MRISDWSSDVCSSDLHQRALEQRLHKPIRCQEGMKPSFEIADHQQGSDRNVPEIKPIDAQDRTIRQDHPANKDKQHIKGLTAHKETEIKPSEAKADQQNKNVNHAPKRTDRARNDNIDP